VKVRQEFTRHPVIPGLVVVFDHAKDMHPEAMLLVRSHPLNSGHGAGRPVVVLLEVVLGRRH
jgi:hypothetical protein